LGSSISFLWRLGLNLPLHHHRHWNNNARWIAGSSPLPLHRWWLILRDGRWPFACSVVVAKAGAGGPGPALGCNVQAQQNIGSALLFLIMSSESAYPATWPYLRTSARKYGSENEESVGHIVAEETCFFGVRSGFQTFFQMFSKDFFQTFWKNFFGKKFGKKWFRPNSRI
jgi:hypothetical protein